MSPPVLSWKLKKKKKRRVSPNSRMWDYVKGGPCKLLSLFSQRGDRPFLRHRLPWCSSAVMRVNFLHVPAIPSPQSFAHAVPSAWNVHSSPCYLMYSIHPSGLWSSATSSRKPSPTLLIMSDSPITGFLTSCISLHQLSTVVHLYWFHRRLSPLLQWPLVTGQRHTVLAVYQATF